MLAPPLPARARSVLGDPAAEVSFSVVSLWEIVIKLGLGRPDIQVDVAALRTNARLSGIEEVPVYGEHVLAVKDLIDGRYPGGQIRRSGATSLATVGQGHCQ